MSCHQTKGQNYYVRTGNKPLKNVARFMQEQELPEEVSEWYCDKNRVHCINMKLAMRLQSASYIPHLLS